MHLVLVAIACEEEGQGNCEQQKKDTPVILERSFY